MRLDNRSCFIRFQCIICSLFRPLQSPARPLLGAVSVELDVHDVRAALKATAEFLVAIDSYRHLTRKTSTVDELLTISSRQSSSEFLAPSKNPSLVPFLSVIVTVSYSSSKSKSVKQTQMVLPSGNWIFWTWSMLEG